MATVIAQVKSICTVTIPARHLLSGLGNYRDCPRQQARWEVGILAYMVRVLTKLFVQSEPPGSIQGRSFSARERDGAR